MHPDQLLAASEIHKLQAALASEKLQHRATRKNNDHLKRELVQSQQRIQALLALDDDQPQTRFRIRATRKTSESVACALLGDWHVEETVKSGSVNGLNRYSLRVAETRIGRLLENLLTLIELNRHGTQIRHLVLHFLGDLMTGFIHQELVESNSLHPVKAVLWLHDKIVPFLRYLLENAKCDITAVCTVGNHGRTTEKKRINTRVENSYEWLLYKMLSKQVPEIDWRIADGYFAYLNIFDAIWRHHHGDDIKYQGGIGGITIPVNKAIGQWDKARKADLDTFGHWHQYIAQRKFVCNGCVIGYSAHALSIKADYEPPSQTFFLWEKDHGRTITTPIFVE